VGYDLLLDDLTAGAAGAEGCSVVVLAPLSLSSMWNSRRLVTESRNFQGTLLNTINWSCGTRVRNHYCNYWLVREL